MSISVSAAFRSVIHYCIICHRHFLHLSFPAMHFPILQIWSHSFQYCILSTLSLLRYSGGWTGGHTLSQYLRMPIDSDCCIYCWQKKTINLHFSSTTHKMLRLPLVSHFRLLNAINDADVLTTASCLIVRAICHLHWAVVHWYFRFLSVAFDSRNTKSILSRGCSITNGLVHHFPVLNFPPTDLARHFESCIFSTPVAK